MTSERIPTAAQTSLGVLPAELSDRACPLHMDICFSKQAGVKYLMMQYSARASLSNPELGQPYTCCSYDHTFICSQCDRGQIGEQDDVLGDFCVGGGASAGLDITTNGPTQQAGGRTRYSGAAYS